MIVGLIHSGTESHLKQMVEVEVILFRSHCGNSEESYCWSVYLEGVDIKYKYRFQMTEIDVQLHSNICINEEEIQVHEEGEVFVGDVQK